MDIIKKMDLFLFEGDMISEEANDIVGFMLQDTHDFDEYFTHLDESPKSVMMGILIGQGYFKKKDGKLVKVKDIPKDFHSTIGKKTLKKGISKAINKTKKGIKKTSKKIKNRLTGK